ncbi:MAG: response regulator [Thaumarchaeota archaeon]|nr:response regulator [Nitrososphaerota archaeon]
MPIRAVVVDDEKETLDVFSELLANHEIKVVGRGYNGQEAVFLFQKLKPDLVFLDVSMPTYDGVYGLKKIRELNPNAVIIMIVERMTLKTEMEMNRLKPSAVFREPIDINEIIRKTHELCAPPKDELEKMQKTLVTLAVKNTLLELGMEELDKVMTLLQKDFNATLDDCYENPEYLKQVLEDLYGDSYQDILNSLKANMKEISMKSFSTDFMQTLNNK